METELQDQKLCETGRSTAIGRYAYFYRTFSKSVSDTTSGPRPVVAALLAVAVTGLGHVYLRRWARALGWITVGYAAVVLFVPETALTTLTSGGELDPFAFAPVVLVGLLSAVDAYRIALFARRPPTGVADADNRVDCPACGKPVDPELGFCHWCTTDFADLRVVEADADNAATTGTDSEGEGD
jgi:hypothetical protein